MSRKNIRDILGLEEGEPLVREEINEKEFEKRMKKVAEYQKICQERKKVNWYELGKIHFLPANLWTHRFYNQNKSRNYVNKAGEFLENIKGHINNIAGYVIGKRQ